MTSHSLLTSIQNTIDCLSKAREESKSQRGDSDVARASDLDANERLNNLERSMLHVIARLDRAEESIQKSKLNRSASNVDEVLQSTERMLRDILLEMIKQQGVIEKYRQENDILREKLQMKPKESVTFSNTTTTINPTPTRTTTPPSVSLTQQSFTTSNPSNPTPTTTPAKPISSTPITSSAQPSSSTTSSKGTHKRPSPAPKAVPPPKQTTAAKGRARASSFGEEDLESYSDEADNEVAPSTTQPATGGAQKTLPVDFPPGYNPNRGRRFSVAGESLNPTSDLSSGPRTIVKKSEEAKRRIRSVIMNNILFKNLDEDQLEDLVDEMFEVRLRPDEVVIRQGDDGDNFYVVDSGELYVLYRDVVVATIGSGKSFGEIALMYNCPRTATVRAKTDCILWGMSRGTFRRSLMIYAIRKRELYESFLARVPLLETLLPYERSIIADALEPRTYRDGDLLIRQGEKGDNFFILERGKVVVTKGDPPVEVKIYGEGDYFGELALLNDQPRAANVRAVGVVRVLTLSREDFANLMGPCEEILKRNMILYQQVQGETSSPSSSLLKPRDLNVLVHEFVSEENSYLRSLQLLVTEFLVPMRKAAEAGTIPIQPDEVASLFSNAEMLLNIHNQFAADVGKLPNMTPAEIAKSFLKASLGFKFYDIYIKNWKTASDLWDKKKNDDQMNQFLKTPSRAPHDFYSLLRAPVDRIPKMVAFLKDVQATTNDKEIAEAATKLSSIGQ